jgi:hypothetical protein
MNLDPTDYWSGMIVVNGFALLTGAAILHDFVGELSAIRAGNHSIQWSGTREMRMFAMIFLSAFLGAFYYGQTGGCFGLACGCFVGQGMLWMLHMAEWPRAGARSSRPGSHSTESEEE